MSTVKTLNQLEIGQVGIIEKLHSKSDMKRRLLDIGLIEGTLVTCLFKNMTSDPTAYFIRGAVIAIREEDAKTIEIRV